MSSSSFWHNWSYRSIHMGPSTEMGGTMSRIVDVSEIWGSESLIRNAGKHDSRTWIFSFYLFQLAESFPSCGGWDFSLHCMGSVIVAAPGLSCSTAFGILVPTTRDGNCVPRISKRFLTTGPQRKPLEFSLNVPPLLTFHPVSQLGPW